MAAQGPPTPQPEQSLRGQVVAVVPAAGRSRRMRRPKLLLPWTGKPLIEHLVESLLAAGVEHVFVVVRPDDRALRAVLDRLTVWVVVPESAPTDMRHSVELALRAVGQTVSLGPDDPWLLTPADHPRLEARTVRRLLEHWRPSGADVLVPTFRGRRGHPTLFRWTLAERVERIPSGYGLNWLLTQPDVRVVELEVDDRSVLENVDTPEDYERLGGLG